MSSPRATGHFAKVVSGCLLAAVAAAVIGFPKAATAGSSPVPVPPPTPTPTPGPGRARPDGPQIDVNSIQSLSLPASEELQPLSTTVTTTAAPVNTVNTVSIPVSAPLSRSAVSNLQNVLF